MNILAFGASNSKNSINKQWATYVAKQFSSNTTEILDLNHFPLPIYSVDTEQESGIPENAVKFYDKIKNADFIIISFAENNGNYTAAYKNLFDWMSRHDIKMFEDKKMLLLSTSPGGRGGLGVMQTALNFLPHVGANIIASFSLPFFQKNFDVEKGILEDTLKTQFESVLAEVKNKI